MYEEALHRFVGDFSLNPLLLEIEVGVEDLSVAISVYKELGL